MPTLILNDQELTTQIGEVVLNVARREAAHIGFVCDGNGLCQTCECRIMKGSEHVNPPNEVEQIWLTQEQIDEGRRLACQVSMRGPGPVEVLTRAEELRRKTESVFSPPAGTSLGENLGQLISSLMEINIEHVRRWPFNMFYSLSNTASVPLTVAGARDVVNDTWRITRSMTGIEGSEYLLEAPEQEDSRPADASSARPRRAATNPASPQPAPAPPAPTPAAPLPPPAKPGDETAASRPSSPEQKPPRSSRK
jgi:ferredoxin